MFATTSYRLFAAASKLPRAATKAVRSQAAGAVREPAAAGALGRNAVTKTCDRLLASAAASGEYDYILVGGGTASCVLAKRLLEQDPNNKILVLEAGSPDYEHKYIKIPAAVGRLFKSEFDWDYTSSGSTEGGLGANHDGVYLCRGKVLGGR